jgi:hypothetical protein
LSIIVADLIKETENELVAEADVGDLTVRE